MLWKSYLRYWSGLFRSRRLLPESPRSKRLMLEQLESRLVPAAGELDPTFGVLGRVTTDIGQHATSDDRGNALTIQSDGKIIAVGLGGAFTRYLPNGAIDTLFGEQGRVAFQGEARGVALQPDGKIVVVGFARNGANDNFSVARYNADGSPDLTFDGDGKVLTDFATSPDFANAVAVQADGKIVVAGLSGSGAASGVGVARYNADGGLDTTFDGDGKATMANFASFGRSATSLVLQADGKILLFGGRTVATGNSDFAVARLNSDGSLDTTFDGDGVVTTSVGVNNTTEGAFGGAVQADGKILAVGVAAASGTNTDFAVVRYNANGSLDTTFDGDGKVITGIGTAADQATSVVVQPDGKIVAVGFARIGTTDDFAVARYNANGSLDTTFDGDGKLTTAFGTSVDQSTGVALQSDGKIVAVGQAQFAASNRDFALARYDTGGTLDSAFDGDGKVTTNFQSSDDIGFSAVVQSDGYIVVSGLTTNGSNSDFALTRYDPTGKLDLTFGGGSGKVLTPFTNGETARAVALQSDGKIVAAGFTNGSGGPTGFAVARYNSDGSLDTSFDGDGKIIISFGGSIDTGSALIIQPDGKILVAGSTNSPSTNFAIARLNSDGSLDTTFDGDGKVTLDFPGRNDGINAMALQSDGKIVVVGQSSLSIDSEWAIVRFNGNGSLDTTFDGDGRLLTAFGPGNDGANGVAIQPDGKIVVVGHITTGTKQNIAVARFNGDGSVDTTFGVGGRQITAVGTGSDDGESVVLQPNGKIVVAGSTRAGTAPDDAALVRYNPDGSLDLSFAGDGIQTTEFGPGVDHFLDVALQADGKIVAVGWSFNGTNNDFALARYEGESNQPPDGLSLSPTGVDENVAVGSVVGAFTSSDPDPDQTFTYDLVAGLGDTDNLSFTIDGDRLKTNAELDFEAKSSYSIRVRTTDQDGLSFEQVFTITVNDLNERPTIAGTQALQALTDKQSASVFAGVTVADVDQPAQTLSMTVTVSHPEQGGFSAASLAASGFEHLGGGRYCFEGTAAEATGALRGLVFVPVENRLPPRDSETTGFTIEVSDGSLTALDGGTSVVVTSVNDAPAITVPAAQVAYEDVGLAITGLQVGDVDRGGLMVTLSVSHGTLTLGTIDRLVVAGNGSGTVTITGSIAALNAALADLTYRGSTNYSGTDVLSVTANDGTSSVSAGVSITVKSVAQQAADLQGRVRALRDAGVLNHGQANSLIVKLNLKGNGGDAGKVQSFVDHVRDFLGAGILSQAQAEELLAAGTILLNGIVAGG